MDNVEDYHHARIEELRGAFERHGVEALWVDPSVNLTYTTGLSPIALERLLGLVITESSLHLVVPLLSRDECDVIEGSEVHAWDDSEGPQRAVAVALEGVRRLHALPTLPFWALEQIRAAAPRVEIAMDRGVIGEARERKDEHEIDAIRRSGRVTDEVLEWVATLDLYRQTERELGRQIQARYLELGHEPSSETIVATGEFAAMPHYAGGDVAVRADAPLLLDFGGIVDHYRSDMTRMFFPDSGDPDANRANDVVLAAYDAALAAVAEGVPCQEVDRAARRIIDASPFEGCFIHRTGHGLGLEVHEPPYLRDGNPAPLEIGHVFSIEPGIYVPGRFGVRYENIVFLGDDGPEEMNHTPRMHRMPRP